MRRAAAQYRHTQPGYLTFVAVLLPAPMVGWLAWTGHPIPALLGLAVLLLIALLFSSLTVAIDDAAVHTHFGPGFWRKRYAVAEIMAAHETTSRWWEGWGIRVTPRGMLYNVSGTGAVELTFASRERIRIGTDEPARLAQAIRLALPPR